MARCQHPNSQHREMHGWIREPSSLTLPSVPRTVVYAQTPGLIKPLISTFPMSRSKAIWWRPKNTCKTREITKILSRKRRRSLTKSAAILNGLTPCKKQPKSSRIHLCQSNLGRRMLLHNRLKLICSSSNSLSRNLLTRIPIRPTLINHCRKQVNRHKYHTIQLLIKSLVSEQMKTTGTRSN